MFTKDYLRGAGFSLQAFLTPELDSNKNPIEDNPQRELSPEDVHPKLTSPFCRIEFSETLTENPGVYIFRVANKVKYVGKAKNLRKRLTGYRTVSAASCKRNGQITNCRINHNVLKAYKNKQSMDLWFCKDTTLEDKMIKELDPPWNRI